MNLKQFMHRHSSEFGKFDRIKNPPSTHRDLCAMLMMARFMTNQMDRVINTASDRMNSGFPEIVFEPNIHDVEAQATEGQVIDLIRCGVRYNGEYHALVMDI